MGGISLGLSKSKSKNTSTSGPAKWVEEASKRGVGYAENALNRGFQPYQGERVAGMSGNEQRASALAGESTSSTDRDMARGAINQAASVFGRSSADGLDRFINPYVKGVLDISNRELGESFGRERQRLQGTAAARGAFGGSRGALLESRLTDDFLQNQSDLYQKGLADAYGRALGASENDLARQGSGFLNAAGQYGALGVQSDAARAQQIEELMRTGALGRGIEQAGYDANYGEYVRGQDYNNEALDRYLASIRAGDYTRTGTNTGSNSGVNLGFKGGT